MKRALLLLLVVACSPTPSPAPSPPPPPSPAPSPVTSAAPITPEAGAPDASPPPSPEEQALVAALKKEHAALVVCHESSKHATGDMTVRVTIGVNGKVEAVSVAQPSTVPRPLEDCILARVRALRVELSPTTVPLPFHFRRSAYDGPTILYGSGPFDPGY